MTFRYTPSGSKKSQLCTLPAEKFIHRFLQHILPKGFVKVRYYGLLAPGQRHRLKQARALLEAQIPPEPEPTTTEADNKPQSQAERLCPECGQPLVRQKLKALRPQAP